MDRKVIQTKLDQLKSADKAYFNSGVVEMSDLAYDKLRDSVTAALANEKEDKFVKETRAYLQGTGVAPDGTGAKVKLGVAMPSLDKIKSDDFDGLTKRIAKICKLADSYDHEFVCSPKLDGSSLQLKYRVDTLEFVSATTRGDGTTGSDATAHAKVLIRYKIIPGKLKDDGVLVKKWRTLGIKYLYVRCEVMISKQVFELKWKDKQVGDKKLTEARNSVNGWISSKSINTVFAKDLRVFGLQLSSKELPNGVAQKFKMLQYLHDSGFTNYRHLPGYGRFSRDELGNANLDGQLKIAVNGPYECDGIVLEVSDYITRHKLDNKVGRPIHSFAYKLSHNATEGQDVHKTTVTKVEWRLTKDGKAQPLVHYKPVMFGSTKNTKATGVNAKHVKEFGLKEGAVVEVVRSGGVIPRIVRTIRPGPGTILPSKLEDGSELVYVAPHLYLKNPRKNKEVKFKQLEASLVYLEVDSMAGKRVQQVFDAGYTTIAKLTRAKVSDLQQLERWGPKMATTVHKSLRKALKDAYLFDLMAASNLFMTPGFALASTRLEAIEDALGPKKILNNTKPEKLRPLLTEVKGLGDAAIDCFLTNLPAFQKFHSILSKTKTI